MIRSVATVILLPLAALAQGGAGSAPTLAAGDLLLCREYPYRSVRNTDLTMYQLARLGFQDARQFQAKHGLKVDNVIGPSTQTAVREEYQKVFGAMSAPTTNAVLAVSAAFVTNTTTCLLRVCVTNVSGVPIRIRGALGMDLSDQITLSEPSVTAKGKVCTRNGGRIGCGGWWLRATLCTSDTVLQPGAYIERQVPFDRLRANQDGHAALTIRFMDASGTVKELTTDLGAIPKETE
jgi:hypothetical protein